MGNRIRVLVGVAVAVSLLLLVLVGYFAWLNIALVDTMHARIEAPMAQVRSPGLGRVAELNVELGDSVAEYESLASIEVLTAGSGQGAPARLLVPLRSPMAGTVVDTATQVNDIVVQGQTVATIADLDQLWVTANIHQTRIPQVRVGQPVRIRVRTRTLRRTFWGWVEQVGGAANTALQPGGVAATASAPRAGEVAVRISIDPAGYTLYPGMMVEARIKLDPRALW
ncbi:MAG: HlyD family efflux transporter periplasmic adaptor subunit [Chloroflexi bacterium]|nr:HlyD family efflux transporter periplasmic adaptor subunit [Chloroflexota bacterium]